MLSSCLNLIYWKSTYLQMKKKGFWSLQVRVSHDFAWFSCEIGEIGQKCSYLNSWKIEITQLWDEEFSVGQRLLLVKYLGVIASFEHTIDILVLWEPFLCVKIPHITVKTADSIGNDCIPNFLVIDTLTCRLQNPFFFICK